MEILSRRRRRLLSAQLVSSCVYEMPKQQRQFTIENNDFITIGYRYTYEPSPPSTKEIQVSTLPTSLVIFRNKAVSTPPPPLKVRYSF